MAEHPMQLRDIRFTLFEHLKVQDELGTDQESLDAIVDAAAKFARDVFAPINTVGDVQGCKRNPDDGSVTTPPGFKDAYQRYVADGWSSMSAGPEDGGQGLPQAIITAVDELFIGACCAFHNYTGLSRACANMLLRRASDEQKKTWASKLVSGEWQGTMALTEPGAGSDVGALTTKATPIDGERYSIQGTKHFITSAEHDMTENFVHIVLARVVGDPGGTKGISIFIVPKTRLDGTPNDVYCSGIEEKMGIHGSVTCSVQFGLNGKCEGFLIGKRLEGMPIMFEIMNEERIVVGLQGNALAATAYGHALRYSRERTQGSSIEAGKTASEKKVAIIEHPDVRRMLLTCKATTEAVRAILLVTSREIDRERRADGEAKAKHERRVALLTPICKAYGSETGFQMCSQAMQVFGGYGYIREYNVEQLVRDSRIACVYEGTNGIQAQDFLFRKVARDKGQALRELSEEIAAVTKRAGDHPRLARIAKSIDARRAELVEVATELATRVGKGQLAHAALDATPFLLLAGNLTGAWLLLEQALVAEEKLAALGAPEDDAARRTWAESRPEGAYYAAKVETARFFTSQVLTENSWRAAQILSGDKSALFATI